MRGLFINELGACNIAPFKVKRDPAIIAAGIAAGASLLGSAMSTSAAGNLNQDNRDWQDAARLQSQWYNTREAQKTREHQLAVLKNEQDYEERMYRDYSSPSAMMRQYREAGMNPYLVDATGATGQSFGSPSAPSAAQASSSIPSAPPTYMGDYSGFGRAGEAMLNGVAVKANVANQSAQTVSQAIKNYIEMSKLNVPKDERDNYLRGQLSLAYGSSFDADRFINALDLDNEQKRIVNDYKSLQLSIEKEFGRTERADKIMNMEQQFAVMAAEIGRMAVQNKFDEASIDRMASEIARNFAAAGLDSANTDLIRSSMQFLVNTAQYEARSAWFDQANKEGQYNINKPKYSAASSDLGQTVEVVDYYTDKVVDKASKLMKVNIGFGSTSTKSRNYSNSWIWNGKDFTK